MDTPAARIQWQRLAVFGGAVRAGAGGQRLAAGIVDAYDAQRSATTGAPSRKQS